MDRLATAEGVNEAPMPGIRVDKNSQSRPRRPLVYEKGVIIIKEKGFKACIVNNRQHFGRPNGPQEGRLEPKNRLGICCLTVLGKPDKLRMSKSAICLK
jgi:hypothetical protein